MCVCACVCTHTPGREKGVQEEVRNECYWQNPRGQREVGAEAAGGALSAAGASVRECALSPQDEALLQEDGTRPVLKKIVFAGTGRVAWRRQHQPYRDSLSSS